MHEILRSLSPHSLVLDLGSGRGSFDPTDYSIRTVRVDREIRPPHISGCFLQADAAHLPFRDRVFDAVICNHSLEHFEQLEDALSEIGRVIKKNGGFYAAVPDSSTVSDILYRWIAGGGGHVNPFSSLDHLRELIEDHTGLPHVGTRFLCTSFCFFNRANAIKPTPKKLLLLAGGNEYLLLLVNYISRILDRYLSTRLSRYGWALYFGNIEHDIDSQTWSNVCVRCGAGHPAQYLTSTARVSRKFFFFRLYSCPSCSAWNFFTPDNLES